MSVYFLFPTKSSIMFKPRYGGGSGLYLYQLSTGLADRGVDVHVVANLADRNNPKVKLHHVNFSGNVISRNLNYLSCLRKVVKEESIVIIFDQAFGGLMPLILKKIRKIKLLFHTTNHYPWLDDKREINPRLYWPVLKTVVKNVDLIVVGNQLLKDSIINRGNVEKDKIIIIPQAFSPKEPERFRNVDIRRKYGLDDDTKLVLYVGRIVPHKGIADIVETAAVVKSKIKNCKFFLVGPRNPHFSIDGKDEPTSFYYEIMDKVKILGLEDSVISTGPVSREDLYGFYKEADVFLFPSYKEGFGTAVLEAMSNAKPIIVYDHPPLNYIISESSGILVPVGDVRKLAEAVLYLIENPEIARQLGENAYKRFLSNFAIEAVMDKWIELFKKLEGS